MASHKIDPLILAHNEWLGFVKPTGLVVSPTAMVRAGAILDRCDVEGQRLLKSCIEEPELISRRTPLPCIRDFREFAELVLNWRFSPKGYAGTEEHPIPDELEVFLADYAETLRPDYAVIEPEPRENGPRWQLLVRTLNIGEDFDSVYRGSGHLEASAHGRMERLLRNTGVAAGLLFNGYTLRLISAPYGESSGWIDFHVSDMIQTAGRPIITALRLLLSEARLLALPQPKRFAALLEDSRKFQNEVSERLAEQVLHALYELLRGFQAAHDASRGVLLREPLSKHPDDVYHAMLTVILRLVFLLYSEERDMLPKNDVFIQHYSLTGLYERLREDAALYPDTMDQRYGAWVQLLVLFRMVYNGADAGTIKLPKRHGVLFDPDRFLFLEGRTEADLGGNGTFDPPLVPDGTIYRALEKLLVLGGERLSYRALDVEQIGSVYETMMGFQLETATGLSVAIKADKKHGAPTTVDIEALLNELPGKRKKSLQDLTSRNTGTTIDKDITESKTIEDIHSALQPLIDLDATPDLVRTGAMILQPSEERRKSGSHYTPRALTEPIVRTTLEPVLKQLRGTNGHPPRPEEILELKICDPAMGSGAFLVETCRQLGDALVEAWHFHEEMPSIPVDEDEIVYARRMIAQRCLYGVDKNPVAVDLSKVSLWLVTLAKDHAFTFMDHALRHGDSLVGLSRRQIEVFHWDFKAKSTSRGFETMAILKQVDKVKNLRKAIREAREDTPDMELQKLWNEAQAEMDQVRIYGDLVIAAFFEGSKPKEREAIRSEYSDAVVNGEVEQYRDWLNEKRHSDKPMVPFHWEIEFPEVFERDNPGFDGIVGNPPFAGKNTTASGNIDHYPQWLQEIHEESHGNSDLVAHFFRRSFNLLREQGAFGLIATNTIAQGDTRSTGLRWICHHEGEIYCAQKRVKWPGLAAVVVSVLHVIKGSFKGKKFLDRRPVELITTFLFHQGGHDNPERLKTNSGISFIGSYILGMGFTFDDTDTKGIATPIVEMHRLIEQNSLNQEVIFPYIGGSEINTSPTHSHHRYVISFGDRPENECRDNWPELLNIVERKVKPDRISLPPKNNWNRDVAERWWQFGADRKELKTAISCLDRVLLISRVGQQAAFTFHATGVVFSESLVVFSFQAYSAFSSLQSRPHEIWARFFGSSMKDDLRYTPSDCFETFPFPENWQNHPVLEAAGKEYYEFRAALMVRNDEGLTKTYNRFHDPYEKDPEILHLRDLHSAMDRAVLDAYGWSDIKTDCEFLLDYEIDNEEEWGNKKKPWRYRWPEEVHDEVLARLLELNSERARLDAISGIVAKKKNCSKMETSRVISSTGDLFS